MNIKKTTPLLLLALIIAGLPEKDVSAGELNGSLTLGAGYLEHPLGVSEEQEAGYLFQALRLTTGFGSGQSVFKVSYEGQASQFGNDTQLGSMRHGLGAEWFLTSKDKLKGLSAGIQGATKSYDDWYAIYEYKETYSYLAFKSFEGSRTLLKGYAGLRVRKYEELPEESYIEPHGQLEIQRFSESRTTLGLRVRYGYKQFNDEVAPQVWGTLNLPSTSQLAARLNFSQGLSQRLGFRAWGEYRWKLTEFPYYVSEDIYDSPILDSYATEGYDFFAALKWLAPMQTWLEIGAAYGDHDYGEILFATVEEDGQTRADRLLDLYGALEKTLPKGIGQPRLKLMGGWREEDSTHSWYDYSGIFASGSLYWKF